VGKARLSEYGTDRSLRYSDYEVVTRFIPEFIRGIKWTVANERRRDEQEDINGEECSCIGELLLRGDV